MQLLIFCINPPASPYSTFLWENFTCRGLYELFTGFLGHLSHSGDLLLWVGVHGTSSVNIFFSRIFTKLGMYSICRVKRQESVNFIRPFFPRGGYLGGKKYKFYVFLLKSLSRDSWAYIIQTECKVMMTKIKLNVMIHRAQVFVLKHGHISHIHENVVKMHYHF